MIDPYVYPGTDVLVNLFDIRDEARLGRIERLVSVEAMVELMRSPVADLPFDFSTLTEIHRSLFADIYPFAGEVREVELSKPESVLSGRSIRYGKPDEIRTTAHAAIHAIHQVDYGAMDGPKGWPLFAEALATLWRSHAFREGNTRAVLLFADLLLRSRGCQVDFSVISRSPSDTRDDLVRASEGYGRRLADLFKEARTSFIRRDHDTFGFISQDAADILEQVSAGRPLPSRMAEVDEPVRGSVLFLTGGHFVLQTSKGLVGVSARSFDAPPSPGDRVSVISRPLLAEVDTPATFDLSRRIRNAMLACPDSISVPESAEDPVCFDFDDPELRAIAESQPDLVSRIAAQVLKDYDPGSWEEWVSGRYYAIRGASI